MVDFADVASEVASEFASQVAEPRPSVPMGPGRDLSGLLRPYSPPNQVCIHVYDVSQESSIQKLNKVLAPASSQLKFGGIFHAGVEVNGLEWSFCSQEEVTKYGVECNQPKSHPNHHFRQTIKMGPTERSEEEIAKIIADMVEEYPGNDYDLLRRNCCHFADDLCQRLGVGCIPSWIFRLANVGAGVATLLETAKSVRHKVIGIPSVGSCSQFAPSRSRRNASCRIIDKVVEPNLADLGTPKAAGILSV